MARRDCVFCSIVDGGSPSLVVGETDAALAILDINPVTSGHTLVLPKQHARDIWSVSADDFTAVADLTRSMAAVLDERLGPDGLTLFQANRDAGWQDIFHLHVHLVPRYTEDELLRPWVSTPEGRGELEAVHRTITGGQATMS